VSAGSAASSFGSVGSLLGSSSFQVGRARDRSAEMELFSHNRKPRSNYRRPSHLGLSLGRLDSKSEAQLQFKPLPASRSHIVSKIPDHLKPEGSFQRESEIKASYRNLSPARPFIHKIHDTLKPHVGGFASKSETTMSFANLHPQRPIIHRLGDHNESVRPRGPTINESSEYRNNFKTLKGERPAPAWITNFEKVTMNGADTSRQ
jgi:hypothetical protein